MATIREIGQKARAAAPQLAAAGTQKKNDALRAIAQALVAKSDFILAQNALDLARAKQNGMADSLVDRLALDDARIAGMAEGVLQVVALEDPIGQTLEKFVRPNGITVQKIRVPLGVIGIIYESRPNVTVDAAVLCLKCGNPVILRGGKEAIASNLALCSVMRDALEKVGLPVDVVTVLSDTSRETANEMMRLNGVIDVLIPRGGASLIRAVCDNATVPIIETGVGNCHVYVDESCDATMALNIVDNAKTQRPSVCNSMETLLIHEAVAPTLLPVIYQKLQEHQVEFRCDARGCAILQSAANVLPATEDDYATEFNDYIMAVKVVDGVDEAIAHIARYGSMHSEAIVTGDTDIASRFLQQVDAAAVYHNASTRFTDGFEFGLGAEIGISTQKMHARGPMGLNELTSVKYLIFGTGQVR